MDGIDVADATQKLRTMCSNWYFKNYTDDCKRLSMAEWIEFRKELYNKLTKHEQYNTLIQPYVDKFQEFQISWDSDKFAKWFDDTQVQVFRILDLINREEKLLSDF